MEDSSLFPRNTRNKLWCVVCVCACVCVCVCVCACVCVCVLLLLLLRTQAPLPDQNQIPATPFPDKDSSREVAAHLTAYDWNLFTNIQQMEYIYQLFGRHKFGKIVTNLDLLIRRFNEVCQLEPSSLTY